MSYPTGVPSPYITHVHPYPTRFHGGIWTRPEFGLPYVRQPYAVFRPSQMSGLGLDWDTASGVFRRPTADGGGVFNAISGLGSASTVAQFFGAAAIAGGLILFMAKRKKMKPNSGRWYKVKEIPPAWVGKPGAESQASYTWSQDPSWAHEYALKRQMRGARVTITPTSEKPPWLRKNSRKRRRRRK